MDLRDRGRLGQREQVSLECRSGGERHAVAGSLRLGRDPPRQASIQWCGHAQAGTAATVAGGRRANDRKGVLPDEHSCRRWCHHEIPDVVVRIYRAGTLREARSDDLVVEPGRDPYAAVVIESEVEAAVPLMPPMALTGIRTPVPPEAHEEGGTASSRRRGPSPARLRRSLRGRRARDRRDQGIQACQMSSCSSTHFLPASSGVMPWLAMSSETVLWSRFDHLKFLISS